MKWTVFVLTAATMTACLFPDLSGLTGSTGGDAASGGDGAGGDASADAQADAGLPAPTKIDEGLGYAETLTVDATSIYFMSSSLGGFFSADKSNGGNRVMITKDSAYSLVVDANNYYWSTQSSVVQLAHSKSGGEITDLTGAITSYSVDGTHVYATQGGDTGSIISTPIGGGSQTTLASLAFPGNIAVDATKVYVG